MLGAVLGLRARLAEPICRSLRMLGDDSIASDVFVLRRGDSLPTMAAEPLVLLAIGLRALLIQPVEE